MISGHQENLLSLFQVYLYLVPLLAIFYLIPSAQMVFMLEQVARETNQKVTTSTKDSQRPLSHPYSAIGTLAVLDRGESLKMSTTSSATLATLSMGPPSSSW